MAFWWVLALAACVGLYFAIRGSSCEARTREDLIGGQRGDRAAEPMNRTGGLSAVMPEVSTASKALSS